MDSTNNRGRRANLEGYSFAKTGFFSGRFRWGRQVSSAEGKAAFLPPISAEANPSWRKRAALPPRETSAWEEKSQLKGAKSLLCTELLRRRDILKLQVEQRALQMAGIKYNGPAMENHPMAAGWFLSCAATQSSRSECGTDHRRPRELPFFVVHRSLRERYSERAMGRYPLPPRSPRISPVQPFLLLAEPKTTFPCLTRAGEQALLAYKEKTPFRALGKANQRYPTWENTITLNGAGETRTQQRCRRVPHAEPPGLASLTAKQHLGQMCAAFVLQNLGRLSAMRKPSNTLEADFFPPSRFHVIKVM